MAYVSVGLYNSSDLQGYVPYPLVLKAAIANAFGNRSLFGSSYQAYKTVKVRESNCVAEIIRQMVKKYKRASRAEALMVTASNYANPVLTLMNMKVCFLLWKRYMLMYDTCDKDSVDIDSDDFKMSELADQYKKLPVNMKMMAAGFNVTKAANKLSHIGRQFSKEQNSIMDRRESRSSRTPKENAEHYLPQSREPGMVGNRRNSTKISHPRLSKVLPIGLGFRKFSPLLPAIKDEPDSMREMDRSDDRNIDDSRQILAGDLSRVEPHS